MANKVEVALKLYNAELEPVVKRLELTQGMHSFVTIEDHITFYCVYRQNFPTVCVEIKGNSMDFSDQDIFYLDNDIEFKIKGVWDEKDISNCVETAKLLRCIEDGMLYPKWQNNKCPPYVFVEYDDDIKFHARIEKVLKKMS